MFRLKQARCNWSTAWLMSIGVLMSVMVTPQALTQSFLESPESGAFESGIGLIRGWVCDADVVDVIIDPGTANERRLATAYPTRRQDTEGECGDADNGFGITINWNNLSVGTHNLRALADGIEFANVDFVVSTLGEEFRTDLSGQFPLSNFPNAGNITTVRWSQPHQNFVIVSDHTIPANPSAPSVPPTVLESPTQGSFESGIGLIRGWVCDADAVDVIIDPGTANERRLATAYPTRRQDTESECGDADNGFGITVNWNSFGDGVHTLSALADGVEFANVNFAVTTLGGDFLRGLTGDYPLADFPASGQRTTLRWSQPHQNFIIATSTATGDKVALIAALLDQLNPFGVIAANPSNFDDLFGVRVDRASDGSIAGLQSLDWSNLDAGLWVRLLLGINGLPEQYRDSGGIEARFGNYTETSVEVSFFRNGERIGEPLTLPFNRSLFSPLQGLLPRLSAAQLSTAGYAYTPYQNTVNIAAATLDPFTVELAWSAGIALNEMLCQLSAVDVTDITASAGCAAPVVSGFAALADAPGGALDPTVQQALKFSRQDIANASCMATEDSIDCLQQAKEALAAIEPEEGSEPPPETETPAVPTNVQASDGIFSDKVSIIWNTVANATAYEVYRNGSRMGQSTAPPFDDFDITPGTPYGYQVAACNGDGCSALSAVDEGFAKTPDPTLVLNTTGTGSGTVSGGGSYPAGTMVTLIATPDANSTFDGWGPSPCAPSFTMPAQDLTCTATFTLISESPDPALTLNTTGTGSGTVSGGGSFPAGTTINLIATPDANSTFDGWSPSPCAASFTMPAQDLTCTATFTLVSETPVFSVTLATAGSGVGTVSGGGQYSEGATVMLLADPNSTSIFGGWNPSPCAPSFTMPAQDLTCTATFIQQHTVTATAGVGGSITPASQTVNQDSTTSFTVTPDGGYRIDVVTGCGGNLNGNTYTTAPITADCTVSASFTQDPPSPPTNVQATDGTYPDRVVITWNPSAGADFYRVLVDGAFLGQPSAETFTYTASLGLIPNVTVSYAVEACNANGCSDSSASDTGYAQLDPPSGLTAGNVCEGDIQLNWVPISGATSTITYNVYRDGSQIISNYTDVTYRDRPGIGIYSYEVEACIATGCSARSAPVEGIAPPC